MGRPAFFASAAAANVVEIGLVTTFYSWPAQAMPAGKVLGSYSGRFARRS